MAALEKLVHWPKPLSTRVRFVAFAIDFRDASVEVYPRGRLPEDWDKKPLAESTQRIGLSWAQEMRSAILQVPSAIIPSEDNFILNPVHPDFHKVKIARPVPFAFDPRLLR